MIRPIVMGTEKAIAFWREKGGFEMVLITEDGELFLTPGLEDRFLPNSLMTYSVKVL